jgi:transglutaminase-like putative cysteine protease
MRRSIVAPLLVCVATSLHAQAPVITPRGDPSVKSDTIYRLAVDPAQYPEDATVLLLDDGVVRFEADGRSVRTFRQVAQILRPEATEGYQEFTFSYAPGHEKMTVNWIRVVRPDGTVISPAPTHEQESDVPAAEGNPVYTDRRVQRYSISGVAPGTIVDWSYTTEELKPFLPGDFLQTWGVTTGEPTMRSRFLVDVPSALKIRIRETNLDFRRRESTSGGRTVYTWARANVPKAEPEPFATDSNPIWMSVLVGSPMNWDDIATWYARNARGRYTVTKAVQEKVSEQVRNARTLDDSISAVHRWVAQDIRYVSIALGLGGYQPRMPDEVISTGYGDCKDKATLFITALRAMGVNAWPVLLAAGGGVERDLPSLSQLDHAIAAIETPSGYEYVDLTSSLTPLGQLPPAEQGQFGLVVREGPNAEIVTLPQDSIGTNRVVQRMVGALDANGDITARYEEIRTGSMQYSLRSAFEHTPDSSDADNFAKSLARKFYPTADADSLEIFDGQDLSATARVSLRIVGGHAAQASGNTRILQLPFGGMGEMLGAATALGEQKPRKFPIDAAAVTGADVLEQEIRLELPAGWHARLPENVTATSPFGSYSVEYGQDGRELRLHRLFEGSRGVQPASAMPELISWFRRIGSDDVAFVVLEEGK